MTRGRFGKYEKKMRKKKRKETEKDSWVVRQDQEGKRGQ